jgi:hypothetical protein
MSATITLPSGEVVLVDEADHEMLSHWRWRRIGKGYVAAHVGHGDSRNRTSYMHRLLLLPDDGQEVDHVNGDRLDNRRANLRACTSSQNHCNRAAMAGTSRYKGVSWEQHAARWVAQIKRHRKRIFLGYFTDEEEAARSYDEAAVRVHGPFARLNFPEEAPS